MGCLVCVGVRRRGGDYPASSSSVRRKIPTAVLVTLLTQRRDEGRRDASLSGMIWLRAPCATEKACQKLGTDLSHRGLAHSQPRPGTDAQIQQTIAFVTPSLSSLISSLIAPMGRVEHTRTRSS